ncbi:MAG: response regulator [Ignavibacteriae bacterium]|nr:MAG: response regulator [Ignavibacteriota bacterium]
MLVFSPDTDLARFLLLNLEEEFQIDREHHWELFEQTVKEKSPDLMLIDLFTHSSDITKQLEIMHRMPATIPVIALRAYMSLSPEMDRSIDDCFDAVFYKPVDVELITQAIEDLLKQ